MTLDEAKEGEVLRVTLLHAEESLAQRLRALGLGEGETFTLLRATRGRRVFYVRTARATAALGAESARLIGVEK